MASKRNEDNWKELDSLVALFEDTLETTTKARNILIVSNQETFGLLTNWEIPEAGDFSGEEPVCTCNITSSKEEELYRTARNVEHVSAPKIREKSELKVKQENILPTTSCTSTSKELRHMHKTSLPSKFENQKVSGNTLCILPSKFSKVQTSSQKDVASSKMPKIRQQSSSTRLCPRKEISTQDFHKLKEDESSSKQILLQNSLRMPSVQRPFTRLSTDQACEQLIMNTCPVHGNGKQQSNSVNLAEAFEVLGVPPEMVKYLRSYHSLATHFQLEDKPTKTSKGKRAAENFIGQLAEMNGRQWRAAEQEHLGSLFQECLPLFTEVFGTEELSTNIEDRIKTLDKRCLKWSNLNEFVDANVYSVDQHKTHSPLQDYLLLNGIWNFKNKRLSKIFQYIRYSNPVQWRTFFKNMQDIQKLDLQLQVFTELEGTVHLLEMCSPDDPSFILLFKAICTMCDINKLCLPVTFKS